jgi:hypothetical protein
VKPLARVATDARFVQDPLSGERGEERAGQTPGIGEAALVMKDAGESGADAEDRGSLAEGRGAEEDRKKKKASNDKSEENRRSKHLASPSGKGTENRCINLWRAKRLSLISEFRGLRDSLINCGGRLHFTAPPTGTGPSFNTRGRNMERTAMIDTANPRRISRNCHCLTDDRIVLGLRPLVGAILLRRFESPPLLGELLFKVSDFLPLLVETHVVLLPTCDRRTTPRQPYNSLGERS